MTTALALLLILTPRATTTTTPQEHAAALEAFAAGLQAERNGSLEIARDAFLLAAALEPDWGLPALQLAQTLRLLGGDPDQRAPAVERALRQLPGSPRANFEAGQLHRARGDLAAAATALRTTLSLRDDYDDARFALAQVLELLGHCSEALPLYERALRGSPENPGIVHGIATCAEALGNAASEEQALLRLLSLAPGNAVGYVRLASFYERVGRGEDARRYRELAKGLTPRETRPKMRPLPPSKR